MIDTVEGQVLALTLAEPPSWTKPYIAYILCKELPDNPTDARMITRRSKAFQVINGELYKRSISGILQRCVTPEDGQKILLDIHEGVCGHHVGSRTLVAKALREGFYWLASMQDVKDNAITFNS